MGQREALLRGEQRAQLPTWVWYVMSGVEVGCAGVSSIWIDSQQLSFEMHKRFDYYEEYEDDAEEYVEGESEMLVEELDPHYEPTKQEIEEYALDVLGMGLPEDEPLLYLAREALKAPLPDSWNAFQSPTEDVYYKHKTTQQKITEHPVDIEYRRRYEQEKEKAARKTLKSKVPLKNLPMSYGGNNPIMSNFQQESRRVESNMQLPGVQEDTEAIRKDEKEMEEYEASLRKKVDNLRKTAEESFVDYERRARNSHHDEIDRLKREGTTPVSLEDRLRSQKSRITSQLDRQFEGLLKKEILGLSENFERNQKNNEIELEAGFNKKLLEEETSFQKKIESLSSDHQRLRGQLETQRLDSEKNQKQRLEELRKALLSSESTQISRELETRISNTTSEIQQRLKQKHIELDEEYNKISKLMKVSPEDRIKEIFAQKVSLQEISNKKIQMSKLKQKKLIENELKTQLLQQQDKLRRSIESRFVQQIKEAESSLESKERSTVASKKKQYEARSHRMQAEIYERFRQKIQSFQVKRNNNINSIRETFIKEIEEKADCLELESGSNTIKMQIEEKKYEIENKSKQVIDARKSLEGVDRKQLKVQFSRKLYRAKGNEEINSLLKRTLEEMKIEVRGFAGGNELDNVSIKEALEEHNLELKEAKKQLQSDKQLLQKVFQHLQSNTILPSYEKKKAQQSMNYSTKIQSMSYATSQLLKKYNKDVRVMRDNAKSIEDFEQLIKRAEADDDYLEELEQMELVYAIPELREELSHFDIEDLGRASESQSNLKELPRHTSDLVSTKKVRQMFNNHSRFLSGIKSQLNSKLAQIRSFGHFY